MGKNLILGLILVRFSHICTPPPKKKDIYIVSFSTTSS